MSDTIALLGAVAALAVQASAPSAAYAQGPDQGPTPALAGAPSFGPPTAMPADAAADAGHTKQCYAKVKFGAQYGAAPPAGPSYGWRQEPGPPGAPGPIWCLILEPSAPRQILISPERYGWIRVLCETDATPARIVGVQRQLAAAGVYRGRVNGRYDLDTTAAVQRFQAQRHIEDRGYLSYATLSALSVYSNNSYVQSGCAPQSCSQSGYYQNGYSRAPPAYPYAYVYPSAAYPTPYAYAYWPLTTFDTGVLTWPGKR